MKRKVCFDLLHLPTLALFAGLLFFAGAEARQPDPGAAGVTAALQCRR